MDTSSTAWRRPFLESRSSIRICAISYGVAFWGRSKKHIDRSFIACRILGVFHHPYGAYGFQVYRVPQTCFTVQSTIYGSELYRMTQPNFIRICGPSYGAAFLGAFTNPYGQEIYRMTQSPFWHSIVHMDHMDLSSIV